MASVLFTNVRVLDGLGAMPFAGARWMLPAA